jgi:hypothetical protein
MISGQSRNFVLAGAALAALAAVALTAGCKGNTTSAAGLEKHVGPPPRVDAAVALSNPGNSDPLTDAPWAKTQWYSLVAPSNTHRTTPPVRAAMLYDPATLYVAFVSDTVPPPVAPIAHDAVSVFLDSSAMQDGTEMAQVTVNSDGHCTCTWVRAAMAAQPKEDGSPDLAHPVSKIVDFAVKGLAAHTAQTTRSGALAWTTVITIPLKALPIPLRAHADAGEHWKMNLLRTITTVDTGAGAQQLQANLSPVYVGGQYVSPYRMADLVLVK